MTKQDSSPRLQTQMPQDRGSPCQCALSEAQACRNLCCYLSHSVLGLFVTQQLITDARRTYMMPSPAAARHMVNGRLRSVLSEPSLDPQEVSTSSGQRGTLWLTMPPARERGLILRKQCQRTKTSSPVLLLLGHPPGLKSHGPPSMRCMTDHGLCHHPHDFCSGDLVGHTPFSPVPPETQESGWTSSATAFPGQL